MLFRRLFIIIAAFIGSQYLISGCYSEKTCTEFMDSYMKLHFYTVYKTGDRVYVKDSILNSIWFVSDNFIDTVANSSTIIVPLSPHADSVGYDVRLNSQSAGLVYFKYKRAQLFINYDCGFRIDYELDTIISAQNSFDSIQIVQPSVSVYDEDHINIYFYRNSSLTN